MQAAMIHHFGPDAIVQSASTAPLLPTADEVVVRIEAAGVNPLDVKMIAGYMGQVFPAELPYIPGTDYSGVVTATGPLATAVKVGDRVVGRSTPGAGGAFADSILSRADALVVIPDEMSFEQAAALPTAFGTARQALFEVGGLQAGQRVLIHAGAGGVGSFAIQLARQAGAHVSATASAGNLAILKELGANDAIDYRTDDFTRLPPFDVILDAVGGETTGRSWGVLREGGTLASLVDFAIAPQDGRHGAFVFFAQATEALREAVEMFRAGELDIIIDSLYPLEQAAAALGKVASGHARGKVVIRTAR
jgi:NADPH:quinone reductase-like Zn-dependent oxidoreductase